MTIAYATDGFFPVAASVAFHCVSFPPSPSPLRLLSHFAEPDRPIISDRRQQAWVSLQSHFVGASEATSARAVCKGLGAAEAVACELFTPLHHVLLVALVSISAAESRRSQRILQLQRSVDVRDEMLKNMQMKLDDLLEQMSFVKDHSPSSGCNFPFKNEQITIAKMLKKNEAKFSHGSSRVAHFNLDDGILPICHNQSIKAKDVCMTEPSKERLIEKNYVIVTEQEERRMSDLSDFWSVASSVDTQPVQLSTLAAEQELYNLRKECEEKGDTIKELTTAAHVSNVTYSKRITELEEVIRRKNMIITKLKKDMLVLEQQVRPSITLQKYNVLVKLSVSGNLLQIVKFTRLRRPSYRASSPSATHHLPLMTENILYDMSSTSPSSSDCDSPQKGGVNLSCIPSNEILLQRVEHRRLDVTKLVGSSVSTLQQAMSPFKENCVSRKAEANASVRPRKIASSISDQKKYRRRNLQEEKMMTTAKKWV
ncbi:hypothetical protein IEQ34_011857 [Dendrobium chrysotoxum]|uniref:Uncharacterized protein n=1 Tax=Dendrobium chrysotoxum TaxID=161865 RepID=A0AAV7GTM6_DENCH|nr:hypothetical protein IEQ34_011857 [Dendrobium chrysotoxum]